MKYIVNNDFIAVCNLESVQYLDCIRFFDSGSNSVFYVNEDAYYGCAITTKSFQKGWELIENNWFWNKEKSVVRIPAIAYQVLSLAKEKKTEIFGKVVREYPEVNEFAVVTEQDNKIKVTLKGEEKHNNIDWETITFPTFLRQYEKIFLSSIDNDCMLGFYRKYKSDFQIYLLDNDNVNEALSLEKNILIYYTDIFPDCNKVSIFECAVVEVDAEKQKKRERKNQKTLSMLHITSNYATVEKRYGVVNLHELIKKFDEGYQSVSIINAEGRYLENIPFESFLKMFPYKYHSVDDDLFLNYNENEQNLLQEAANIIIDTSIKEIPVIKDGKVISSVVYSNYFDHQERRDFKKIYRINWDWISDEVAKDFFGNKTRWLLSSNGGALAGFLERFSKFIDIDIYNDSLLPRVLNGSYDALIYEANLWSQFYLDKYQVWDIYADLLEESVVRYLKANNIDYYYFDLREPLIGIENRMVTFRHSPYGPDLWRRNAPSDYMILDYKKDTEKKMGQRVKGVIQSCSGRRYTISSHKSRSRKIYLCGTCFVWGFAADNSRHTFASFLQEYLNQEDMPYQVVSCGARGTLSSIEDELNMWYRIMDTNLHEGDIVIMFGFQSWKRNSAFVRENIYMVRDIFLKEPYLSTKCFIDASLTHMNKDGYWITAQYVYGLIKEHLKNNKEISNRKLNYFSQFDNAINLDESLQAALNVIKTYKNDNAKSCGVVFIKGDIFTKGHLYLVKKALEKVKHLYVFLTDDGPGEFGVDCEVMVKKNLQNVPNVTVIPPCHYKRFIYGIDVVRWKMNEGVYDTIISNDAYVFCRYIAPMLNIVACFSGDDIADNIEHEKKEMLRDFFETEDISWITIPRLTVSGWDYIESRNVRKLIKENGIDACKNYLTNESYIYLQSLIGV